MDELAPFLLKCLLQGLPETIYFKDRESRLILVSEYKAFLHGFNSAEEMIGKSDTDLFSEEHARIARAEELEIMESGIAVVGKVQKLTWPDGHESWTLSSKMPVIGPGGRVIGTFGVAKDITRTRKMEEALERAQKKLVETSRIAGAAEVASGVLHNVANVITAVNCSAEVVIEGLREMDTSHLLQLCENLSGAEELKALARTFDKEKTALLSMSKTLESSIEHASKVIKLQQADAMTAGAIERMGVQDLVEDALRITAEELKSAGVEVVRDYRSDESVLVNKHRALEVLINLIQNALHAVMRTKDRPKTLTLSTEVADTDHVTISVTDNGVGIPRENLSRLFSYGFTTRKEGHGFGLRSSVLAAQGMGALLSAYSDGPDCGATFVFMLLSSKNNKAPRLIAEPAMRE